MICVMECMFPEISLLNVPYSKKYYITPHMYQEEFFRIVPEVCFIKLYVFLSEREIENSRSRKLFLDIQVVFFI